MVQAGYLSSLLWVDVSCINIFRGCQLKGDGRESMRMHMCIHTEIHTSMRERGLETKEETNYLDCFRTQILKCEHLSSNS